MSHVSFRRAEQRLWESVGVIPTEQRLHLGRTGATIRVQEVGQGPAAVFVHGVSCSGSVWAPLVARLEGFRCVVLDRPGCGLSDPLDTRFDGAQSFTAFAGTLLTDVLDAMGLESAHVVATSFGGYFALCTAAAHADRVRRMVEFGWMVGAPARLPALMRVANAPVVGRLLAAVPPNERAVRMMLRQIGLRQAMNAGRVSQELIDWYLSLLRHTDTMRNEMTVNRRLISPLGNMDRVLLPASTLATIQTPIHFLWGAEDPMGGAEIARRFVRHIPNAELELMPGAGHAVWLDDPDHVARATRSFLCR